MSRPVKVICKREIHTDVGVLKYGDVIAIMQSELDPLTVASMLAYGQAAIVAIEESEVTGDIELAKVQALNVQSDVTSTSSTGADEKAAEDPPSGTANVVPDQQYAASEIDKLAPEADAGTIMAVKDLGITTLAELRERLATGERLKGIGDQRRKQLNEILEKKDGSTSSSAGLA